MIKTQWSDQVFAGESFAGPSLEVRNPFNAEVLASLPTATIADVERVVAQATASRPAMRRLSAHDRADLLDRAGSICDERQGDLAGAVAAEQGKTLAEASGEASRLGDLLRYCAGETRRIGGEVLPLGGSEASVDRIGFTLQQPVGVVAAVTPFNYPLLLVAHKVGPALAAGNSVVVKPSSETPLSCLMFLQCLLDAGFPDGSIVAAVGSGSLVGTELARNANVGLVSLTGSRAAGDSIARSAGAKRLMLELGANCPVVVMDDANLDVAADLIVKGGTINAGQVCISVQRVLVHANVYDDFVGRTAELMAKVSAGDPMVETSQIGTLVNAAESQRVNGVLVRAVEAGARMVVGGERDGALHQPTLMAEVEPGTELFDKELFGPAIAVTPVESVDQAIFLCNDTNYGLGAGVFTEGLGSAKRFIEEVDAGLVHVNWTPLWRVDPMPYGGVKQSGFGKEGPKYAIEAMSDFKSVVIHP